MASKKGKTICLFSSKGGVGKTIMTLNLAGICEKLQHKTLIIDLDLTNGGISVALNREVNKSIYNLIDDINNNRYKEFKDYVTKYDEYIDFLASPKDPRQGNKIDSKYIEVLLDRAAYLYDVILIDTTHSLNELNLVTLDLVNEILFLVTNDPLDLKNMKSLISIFRDLEIDKYKMILNNSCDIEKDYFSIYDLRNIIKTNIDYVISNKFYIKNIDTYVMNGEIITLLPKVNSIYSKDYFTLSTIMIDILGKSEGDKNE